MAEFNICDRCDREEALESAKANRDIGKLYEDAPGVKNRLDRMIIDDTWEKG